MSDLKGLNNKMPMHRRRKELIVIFLITSFIISLIFFYTYIKYSPITPSKYPRINIICDEKIERDNYLECTFELISENPNYIISPIKSKIKLQGMTNAELPKKGYRLELSKEKSLLGMRRDDDWILFAMYLDYPRMRIKLSFDLWRSLEPTNPTAILPKSEYVSVYLNGEFKGLYLLAEKADRRLFDLDDAQDNIDSSLIFESRSNDCFRFYSKSRWQQDWPNEYEEIYIMENILTELIFFINNSDDEKFFDPETGVYTKFDKLNLIDFLLFNFFQVHIDFWSNNFYVIRNTNPSKFFLIPWDFDGSFGQKGSEKHSVTENPESLIISVNRLYERLLDNKEFRHDCKNRWIYLREELWTEEYILDILSDIYEEIKEILEIEVLKWKRIIEKEDDGKEFIIDEYINDLYQWIPKRLEFCDEYFLNY
jgi:spore coat protein CotH